MLNITYRDRKGQQNKHMVIKKGKQRSEAKFNWSEDGSDPG